MGLEIALLYKLPLQSKHELRMNLLILNPGNPHSS